MSWFVPMLIGAITSLVAVFTTLYRVIQRGQTRALRFFAAGSSLSLLSSTIRLPAVSALLVVNEIDLTWLVTIIAGWLCMHFMLCMVRYTLDDGDQSARLIARHRVVLMVAIIVLITLFLLAQPEYARDFSYHPQDRYMAGGPADSLLGPLTWLFQGVYQLYPLQALIRTNLRWARKASSIRWLSIALHVYSLGALISLVVELHVIAYQLMLIIPGLGPPPWTEAAVETWPLSIAGTFTMTGLAATGLYTVLAGSPRLHLVRDVGRRTKLWWQYYRTDRRLYRLWRTLQQALSADTHYPPRFRLTDVMRWRSKYHLYRRLIDLRDFQRSLRAFTPEATENLAMSLGRERGLDRDVLAAVTEAAALAVGCHFRRMNEMTSTPHAPPAVGRASVDMAQEARWWLQVARAYFRSPVVPALLAKPAHTSDPATTTPQRELTATDERTAP